MKDKRKKHVIAGILVAAMGSTAAQASMITVLAASNLNGDGSASEGVLALTTAIASVSSSPQSLVYQISGLDVDGVGGANDTVDLTFTGTTDGQTFNAIANGDLSSGGVWLNGVGEYIQITYSSMSVNLNGGTGNGFGSFLGFTELTATSFTEGDVALVNGVTKNFDGGGISPWAIPGESFIKLEQTVASDTVRMANWDFGFSATNVIPEPASLTLFGLGCALVAVTRHRRARTS